MAASTLDYPTFRADRSALTPPRVLPWYTRQDPLVLLALLAIPVGLAIFLIIQLGG